MDMTLQMRALSQTGKWAHIYIILEHGPFHDRGKDFTATPDFCIADNRVGTDHISFADLRISVNKSAGQDDRIPADLHTSIDIGDLGIHHADAVQHMLAIDAHA